MKDKNLRINVEIHALGDGRTFLNYWGYVDCEDIVAELKDGKLYKDDQEITLKEYIDDIKSSIEKTDSI